MQDFVLDDYLQRRLSVILGNKYARFYSLAELGKAAKIKQQSRISLYVPVAHLAKKQKSLLI
jgi:hypothetical protein